MIYAVAHTPDDFLSRTRSFRVYLDRLLSWRVDTPAGYGPWTPDGDPYSLPVEAIAFAGVVLFYLAWKKERRAALLAVVIIVLVLLRGRSGATWCSAVRPLLRRVSG